MAFLATLLACLILLVACSRSPDFSTKGKAAEGTTEEQYKKEVEEVRKTIKGEVKIKLKKDGKGLYTWEIQGKDPQEVLKVNETLRKKLGE